MVFFIHSVTLCLLIEFNPFIFKVINALPFDGQVLTIAMFFYYLVVLSFIFFSLLYSLDFVLFCTFCFTLISFSFFLWLFCMYFLCGYQEACIKQLTVITVYSKILTTSAAYKSYSCFSPHPSHTRYVLDIMIYTFLYCLSINIFYGYNYFSTFDFFIL